jgi:hypothetical protein
MNVEELKESAEHAHNKGEKAIGLTMAIVAVLLALATLLGHRAHTEESVIQGERNTLWVNYDAKRTDARVYDADARIAALLPNGQEVAADLKWSAGKRRYRQSPRACAGVRCRNEVSSTSRQLLRCV